MDGPAPASLPGPNPVPTPEIPAELLLPPEPVHADSTRLPEPPAPTASRAQVAGRSVPWTAAAPGEFDDFVALVQGRPDRADDVSDAGNSRSC